MTGSRKSYADRTNSCMTIAMARPRRSLAVPANIPPETIDPEEIGDDLTEEEIEQASVGDLISIQGPEFDNVSWSIWRHRTRTEMMNDNSDEKLEWVADRTGQLHGTDLVELIGGGTFNMRGYVPRSDGRGVRLKFNRTVAIAGPRKNFSVAPVQAAPAPTPTNGELTRGERMMLRMVKAIHGRLETIEKGSNASAPQPTSLKDLAETLKTLHELGGARPAPRDPDKEVVNGYLQMIQQGIELGREREPLPAGSANEGPDWGKIAETGMQLLDKLLARAAAQRAQAMRGGRPNPPSHAAVVDEPQPAVVTMEDHRWSTAFESLAGAITDGEDPADFALTLARILNKTELAEARFTPEKLVPRLQAAAAQFPVLATEAGQIYVNAVLMELNRPDEPEPTE
jgi:hypothetical protein